MLALATMYAVTWVEAPFGWRVTGEGMKTIERPGDDGEKEPVRATFPLKSPIDVTVRVNWVLDPCTSMILLFEVAMLKSRGSAVTTRTGAVVGWRSTPFEEPVIVIG